MAAGVWFGFQPEEYQQKTIASVGVYLMIGLGWAMIYLEVEHNHEH